MNRYLLNTDSIPHTLLSTLDLVLSIFLDAIILFESSLNYAIHVSGSLLLLLFHLVSTLKITHNTPTSANPYKSHFSQVRMKRVSHRKIFAWGIRVVAFLLFKKTSCGSVLISLPIYKIMVRSLFRFFFFLFF